jgi:ribosomal protein S20
MLQFVIGMINNSTLLVFGIFVSAAILSIPFNKKNVVSLLVFCVFVNVLQYVSYANFGLRGAEWFYPFFTHLTSILLFCIYYKKRFVSSLFAVMSAYLFSQLSRWFSLLALAFSSRLWVSYGVRAAFTLLLGFLILRHYASSIAVILTKPRRTILIFSSLPIAYYLFDYIASVYTDLLYTGTEVVYEFLPFVLSVAYLIFGVVYFKEYEEKVEAEQHNQMMQMKRAQSEREIEAIKRSEYQVSLLRHDMRHFMSNIISYIEQGDAEKAKTYISDIISLTDETAMKKYCDNGIVNMILSSYENEIMAKDITFHYSIRIPADLPISDVDMTSILSNGMENAIHAVSIMDPARRKISLDIRMSDDKLLLAIKNPFDHSVDMVNGVPRAREEGHGLGTHSIKYITEKLNGHCQFLAQDGLFVLRVVI